MTVAHHTSAKFARFLDRPIATQPKRHANPPEIHIIIDNLSAHKTKAVSTWLDAHPQVEMHYTPTIARG